jgi:hypothetical protein
MNPTLKAICGLLGIVLFVKGLQMFFTLFVLKKQNRLGMGDLGAFALATVVLAWVIIYLMSDHAGLR